MGKRPAMETALDVVRTRVELSTPDARARWAAAVGATDERPLAAWAPGLRRGRLTLNLHPDRIGRSGSTVAAGLLADGCYRSQWVTGTSNGSRSAFAGGDRHRFERALFGGAYDGVDPDRVDLPVYGALDLLHDPFGGSPRFGSSFVVLAPHVLDRTTLCVGDSHVGPRDVGTVDAPWCLLAGLAEHAASGLLLDRPLGIDELLAILDGRGLDARPRRSLDGYVEAQVHGGVDLAADAEAIVVDPSFAGTPVGDDLARAAERFGVDVRWNPGSEQAAADVPPDFRGHTMPTLARQVARPDGIVDAHAIGAAAPTELPDQLPGGDPADSPLQQLKYLWHTLFALGHDAVPTAG